MIFSGLYAPARALALQSERQDAIAENIANAGTTGFRRVRVGFESFSAVLDGALVGGASSDVVTMNSRTDTTAGQLHPSGNPCDLALVGSGYFSVQDGAGRAYTRNGAFRLDADGFLVDQQNLPVLGRTGPIRIDGDSWSVSEDGTVVVDGAPTDQLLIVDFPAEIATRQGDGLFSAPAAAVQIVADPQVRQGTLEASNVQTIEEMIQMITAMRAFEANQRMIQAQDQILDRAVNEVGRA